MVSRDGRLFHPGGRGRPPGYNGIVSYIRKALDDCDGILARDIVNALVERAKSPQDQRDSTWLASVRLLIEVLDGPIAEIAQRQVRDDSASRTAIYTDGARPPADE